MWHYCLLMSVLGFILSNAHFYLSYGKLNYCNIRNSIIKTAISDRKHFLEYIYVSKILFLLATKL